MPGDDHSHLTVPQYQSTRFILPCGRTSSEFLRFDSRPPPFGDEHYLPGFRPSSRHHPRASTQHEGCHTLATFRPRTFAAPRRFTPLSGLQASFILQPRPGFVPFRGFSLSAAVLRFRAEPCPLDVASCSLAFPFPDRQPRSRRSTSRPLSTPSSVAQVWCYPPLRSLPSSGSVLLQVPTLALGSGSPSPSAHGLRRQLFGQARRFGRVSFSVFPASDSVGSSPSQPTCSRFRATLCSFFRLPFRTCFELGSLRFV
jgi:hypothetical protein